MAWTNPKTWTVGELVTAANMNTHVRDNFNAVGGPSVYIYKATDELIQSSTTFQDDNDFFFTVAANEKWMIELNCRYIADSTGDIKFQWTFPAGAAGSWWGLRMDGNGSLSTLDFTRRALSSTAVVNTSSNIEGWIIFYVGLTVSSTPGTMRLQWAQNASIAVDTGLKADSFLIAHRTL